MTDVLVTLPQSFGLAAWIAEGPDLPGASWSGQEWHWYMGGAVPRIRPGERVYVCYKQYLIGYAPLVRIEQTGYGRYALVQHGGAQAVTIPETIPGFRGYQYRWWQYADERPFSEWMELAKPQPKPHKSSRQGVLL